MSRYWYFYDGTGDEYDPGNYTRQPFNPIECNQGQISCAIYAHPSSLTERLRPLGQDLVDNSALKNYILAAKIISGGLPSYPVPPSNKPFVYFRATGA